MATSKLGLLPLTPLQERLAMADNDSTTSKKLDLLTARGRKVVIDSFQMDKYPSLEAVLWSMELSLRLGARMKQSFSSNPLLQSLTPSQTFQRETKE